MNESPIDSETAREISRMRQHNKEGLQKVTELQEQIERGSATREEIIHDLDHLILLGDRGMEFPAQLRLTMYDDDDEGFSKEMALEVLERLKEQGEARPETYQALALHYFETDPRKAERTLDEAINQGKINAALLYTNYFLREDRSMIKRLVAMTEDETNEDWMAFQALLGIYRTLELGNDITQPLLQSMVEKMIRKGVFLRQFTTYRIAMSKISTVGQGEVGTLAVKESEEGFERELQVRRISEGIVRVPQEIILLTTGNRQYYVMEFAEGEVLTELIKANALSEDTYDNALRELAKANVHTPRESFTPYDYLTKARKHAAEFDARLVEHTDTLANTIEQGRRCVSRDPHTDNLMALEEGGIMFLDTADKGLATYAAEAAHILGFVPFYKTMEEKVEAAERYADYVITEGGEIEESFLHEFLAATVERAMDKAAYYQRQGRTRDVQAAIRSGIDALNYLIMEIPLPEEEGNHYIKMGNIFDEKLRQACSGQ
ncbi:hypothetical protein HN592_01640 [Candidatus Woesearchaeota archaeon]|jgi:hypothetical protein|nr:hypothetical protein [Candidatus Woesearchaeota archaeon]MBT4368614.1 hypothetical protein [Candidatus Woesearchaeota archaeon]MBT4713077.1 hypothetical protein [Candidatus Woesearchaeota archaeon]MBT6638999.1 hypothetical protein [Candidatus Woesearchaeota archaeon]MBT7134198.1 hypothetical protein [Candidatus Woesearchaeota archaeon]